MAKTEPSVGSATGTGQLARGSLRTTDAIAISVSVLAPGMAMALNTGGVAGTAGGSTPLSFVLGGVACLTLGFVIIGFTRRMAVAGYAYTYASRSLGKQVGFLAGWMYAFGMAAFVPMTMAGVGALAANLLGINPGYWVLFFIIGMALLMTLSVVRIKVTTKVQIAVAVVTVAILLVMDLVITAKGGAHGQSAAPFTFSKTATGGFHGVFYGIILGVTSYIGFETAADFGEETANPRRAVPTAVIVSVLFAIVFYVWTTYAATIGFGVNTLAHNPSSWVNNGLIPVATRFIGTWFGKLIDVGAMLSAFIVSVACATASSRTLFAMGREGVAPAWMGRTHAQFKTPVNATVVVSAVSVALGLIIGYGFSAKATGGQAFTVYYFWATAGTLAIILVYITICIGGIAFFKQTSRRFNPLTHLLIPLVGAVIFAAAWYGSVYPVPVAPLNATPYLTAVWLLLGAGVLVWLNRRRPDSVARIGSILGEEGGELVAALED
jgi:amino acid transporter